MPDEVLPAAEPVDSLVEEAAPAQETQIGIGPLEDRAAELEAEAPPGAAETPAAEPAAPAPVAPATTTPVTPASGQAPPVIAPEIQQYIARLEQQNQLAQQQNEAKVLQDTIAQYAQRLEEQQGFSPEQAQYVAQREGDRLYQQYQAERFRQGQINAAFAIGQEFGVDPHLLLSLPTPEAMRAEATKATAQGKIEARILAVEKENAELKKKLVPAQRMDSGTGAGSGRGSNREAIRDRYLEGAQLTIQEKAILFPDR